MSTYEILVFSVILVIVGFLSGYGISQFTNKPSELFPEHSVEMAGGLFVTGIIVFNLYNSYKSDN